jgi:ribosome-binding factor A
MSSNNVNKHRRENMTEFIKNCAGDFFARNTTGSSMITVTNVWISEDLHNADIFISVLPESKSDAALNFAKRKRTDLQKYVLSRVKLNHLPMFEIILDKSGQIYDKLYGIK